MISATVKRARAGDEAAFAELYHENKARVHGVCWQMTRSVDDADDLTQESFMLAFRHLRKFRGHSAFSTWLHRITVRVVLMKLRHSKTMKGQRLVSLDQPITEDGKTLEIPMEDAALRGEPGWGRRF